MLHQNGIKTEVEPKLLIQNRYRILLYHVLNFPSLQGTRVIIMKASCERITMRVDSL